MRDRRTKTARILLVDDNRVNRLLLGRNVELLGHRVDMVENGLRALDALRSGNFDLMLMDIEMPELNGFELLEHLRSDPSQRDIPVIVTSGLEGIANVIRCIELGADDYLHKPVNPVLLRARINSSLEKKRLRDEQRELIRRFATHEVAQELEISGFELGGRQIYATVMFVDIRGFTTIAESQPPEEVIEMLNTYYTLMFAAVSENGGVINQMIGDGLMAVFGAPVPMENHVSCAASAAQEMIAMAEQFSQEQVTSGKPAIHIGIGIATGKMAAGYTGTKTRATYTCIGDTVNLAARLEAHTKATHFDILLDGVAKSELSSGFQTEALGKVQFKGKTNLTDVFGLLPPNGNSV